jgi:hypothetical protein
LHSSQRFQVLVSVQNEMNQASRFFRKLRPKQTRLAASGDDLLLQMATRRRRRQRTLSGRKPDRPDHSARSGLPEHREELNEARLAVTRLQAEIKRLQQGGAEMDDGRGEIHCAQVRNPKPAATCRLLK